MTPYTGSSSQVASSCSTSPIFNVSGSHPILNGVVSTTGVTVSPNSAQNFYRINTSIRSGATSICSYCPSAGSSLSMVAIGNFAGNRISSFNIAFLESYGNASIVTANGRRLFTNTVLWTAGMI
jgi:hypothetical protein